MEKSHKTNRIDKMSNSDNKDEPQSQSGLIPSKSQKSRRKISLPWFRQNSVSTPKAALSRQHTIDSPGSFRFFRQPATSYDNQVNFLDRFIQKSLSIKVRTKWMTFLLRFLYYLLIIIIYYHILKSIEIFRLH